MTKLTVTGTGDSLFVARFPEEYAEQIGSVADFIKSWKISLLFLSKPWQTPPVRLSKSL